MRGQEDRAGPCSEVRVTTSSSPAANPTCQQTTGFCWGARSCISTPRTRGSCPWAGLSCTHFEKHHPFGSDIVMLQLRLPVKLTAYIAPACLPSPSLQLSSNLSCWITGWGMLSEDSEGVWEMRAGEGCRGEGRRGWA